MTQYTPELRSVPLTFMDCPDIGELFKEQCYFNRQYHGGTCKVKRDNEDCPRGYAS